LKEEADHLGAWNAGEQGKLSRPPNWYVQSHILSSLAVINTDGIVELAAALKQHSWETHAPAWPS
jgi:hypothetical protein